MSTELHSYSMQVFNRSGKHAKMVLEPLRCRNTDQYCMYLLHRDLNGLDSVQIYGCLRVGGRYLTCQCTCRQSRTTTGMISLHHTLSLTMWAAGWQRAHQRCGCLRKDPSSLKHNWRREERCRHVCTADEAARLPGSGSSTD